MENDSSLKQPKGRGWMYVEARLNNKAALPMLHTGATSNIIDLEEAKRLGLKITRRGDTKLKIISAKPTRNVGWARNVETRVGNWQGTLDFLVTPLDNCKIVLRLDFLDKAHALINTLKKTLEFPDIRREVPLKRMRATSQERLNAMRIARHHLGKRSSGNVATRTLRRLSGAGCHVPRNDPTFCTKTCYETPRGMLKRSQAHPNNNSTRPCDSPHVPPTHANGNGMCPQKCWNFLS